MRDSTVLPDLRMLPSEALLPHEDCDPRRVEKLVQRLRQEGRLKNPPIVADIPGTERFVVLDGANRSLAFQSMGIPHIVAQVVSYGDPGVVLDTWYHVVSGMPLDAFEAALAQVDGMQLRSCSLEQARAALATDDAAAYIVCEQGVRLVCKPEGCELRDIRLLNDIVSVYKGRADIFAPPTTCGRYRPPITLGSPPWSSFPDCNRRTSCRRLGMRSASPAASRAISSPTGR